MEQIAIEAERNNDSETAFALSGQRESLTPITGGLAIQNSLSPEGNSSVIESTVLQPGVETPAIPRVAVEGVAVASEKRRIRRRKENPDDEDLVRLYLQDIGQHTLLTKDQEVELAKSIESGREARELLANGGEALDDQTRIRYERLERQGKQAKEQFINSNLRLVVSIAKRYQASGLPLLDLIQEGNFGLMHAIDKFDWEKGFKFSTYATWWIRQTIQRGIANTNRTIRLPVHLGDDLARLNKTRLRLEQDLGRSPSLVELAQEECTDVQTIVQLLIHSQEPSSLDEPLTEDSTSTHADIAGMVEPGYSEVEKSQTFAGVLREMLAPLDEREREILKLRYGLDSGEPWTLEEIGEHFNLTRERIRQIEFGAYLRMRNSSNRSQAEDLLS